MAQSDVSEHHLSGSSILYATLASVVVGGPLLGMMGFALLATTPTFLVAAPLLLLFSPILVPVGFVLAASVAGFGFAVVMGYVGMSALTWACRAVGGVVPEMGQRVKEQGMDFGWYLQQKGQNGMNRAS